MPGSRSDHEFLVRRARWRGAGVATFHRMEAQPAFIAQPALVDVDIAPADRSVDLAVGCGVAGNAATHRASRMIDAQIAAGAAAAADRAGSLEKPDAHLESKIRAGQRANRTDIDDIAGIWIVERLIAVNGDFRSVSAIQDDDLAGLRHVARESDAARAEDAAFLIQLDQRSEIVCLLSAGLSVPG